MEAIGQSSKTTSASVAPLCPAWAGSRLGEAPLLPLTVGFRLQGTGQLLFLPLDAAGDTAGFSWLCRVVDSVGL